MSGTILLRTAVLVSGGGSNLEAILVAGERGELPRIRVVLVVSTRSDAFALTRAHDHGVEAWSLDPKHFGSDDEFQSALLQKLREARIDLICLAGYLRKLSPAIVRDYRGRILNIHPALLPKFGGPGMYGHFVHEAVLASGERESGCTVHLVDEEFDHGPILAQARVPVRAGDTPEQLAARVLEQEHRLYPKTINDFSEHLAPKGPAIHHD
ncbi:MAG TPA: phosphoribosylglycinamide formyltransferase [Elusimicrobiota bacterium]|nr:phosphoribosylglycinamide formyltransferase [Elusimicrobiota bacterium]